MTLAVHACAVILTFAALQPAAPPVAPDLRNLRWVHATVSASSGDSVTLRLKDRELVVHRDQDTEIVAPDPDFDLAVGATVEVHYAERRGVRRAIVIVVNPAPAEISKRPKSSLRGTLVRLHRSTLSVRSGTKTRGLMVEKKSRLIDRDGRALATGRDEIGKQLSADVELLVKWESDSGVIVEGVDLGGSDKAVEIRKLR